MTDPQGEPATVPETAGENKQRVACTSCGRFLLKIGLVSDPDNACFELEAKCKGCHKTCSVIYRHGKITVSLL